MFYRTIIDNLKLWKNSNGRKPLILRGARQTGKTTAVELFSREFDNYLYLNLEKKDIRDLFTRGLSPRQIIQASHLLLRVPVKQGSTLLFIDEIQNSQEAIAMMRYFFEDTPEYYVIGAGSLLDIMLEQQNKAFPVGRVQYLYMYPLSFREFLVALQEEQALSFYDKLPCDILAHTVLLQLFHLYVQLGGMPEIINRYRENRDITQVQSVYQSLMTSYTDDIGKYSRHHTMTHILKHILETSPIEAGRRIKFERFGNSPYRSREVGEAFRTLERTLFLSLVYPTTAVHPPVSADLKKSPRLQLLDTGLINYTLGIQGQFYKFDDLNDMYQGTIAEHIVGQELTALDMNNNKKLLFWVREKHNASAEIDYVYQYNNHLIPIEVKSGKTGTLRSLHQYMDQAPHDFAIRLYAGELYETIATTAQGKKYRLINIPYYLTGKLPEYLEWYFDPVT